MRIRHIYQLFAFNSILHMKLTQSWVQIVYILWKHILNTIIDIYDRYHKKQIAIDLEDELPYPKKNVIMVRDIIYNVDHNQCNHHKQRFRCFGAEVFCNLIDLNIELIEIYSCRYLDIRNLASIQAIKSTFHDL